MSTQWTLFKKKGNVGMVLIQEELQGVLDEKYKVKNSMLPWLNKNKKEKKEGWGNFKNPCIPTSLYLHKEI
jgi:hypothetical protein